MKTNRKKLELAMARACMSTADLQKATGMPRPTINNAISGRGIGRVQWDVLRKLWVQMLQKLLTISMNRGEVYESNRRKDCINREFNG